MSNFDSALRGFPLAWCPNNTLRGWETPPLLLRCRSGAGPPSFLLDAGRLLWGFPPARSVGALWPPLLSPAQTWKYSRSRVCPWFGSACLCACGCLAPSFGVIVAHSCVFFSFLNRKPVVAVPVFRLGAERFISYVAVTVSGPHVFRAGKKQSSGTYSKPNFGSLLSNFIFFYSSHKPCVLESADHVLNFLRHLLAM